MMFGKSVALVLLLVGFGFASIFVVEGAWLWILPTPLLLYATLTIMLTRVRELRFTFLVTRIASCLAALMIVLWLLSITMYIRVPYRAQQALTLGNGNFGHLSRVGYDAKPLTVEGQWLWSGVAAGKFGSASQIWNAGRFIKSQYWAAWPLVIAVTIPTAILWFFESKRRPPGTCENCGYNLAGLTESRCPECFTAFDPSTAVHP